MLYICSVNIIQYIQYFIRSIWYRGFFFTCKLLYFEIYYERKIGIETLHIENLESLDTLSDDYENNHHYQGASYYVLVLLFDEFKKHSDSTTFIDYGCGKGRVLIMAAIKGFKDIVGIDLAKELCDSSNQNINQVKSQFPTTHFHVIQADATTFSGIDHIQTFFFFNPFGRSVMNLVVEQINQSILRNPRDIYIIYVNPLYVDCFIHNNYQVIYELRSKDYREGILLKFNNTTT